MAEGLFLNLIEQQGVLDKYIVDSAGTAGYHIGARPDERMLETAANHNVELPSFARKFEVTDFTNFDYIIAMDQQNLEDIESLRPSNNNGAQVFKMRDFDEDDKGGNVPDPYYGGQSGFENVYQILKKCNLAFIAYLEKNTWD